MGPFHVNWTISVADLFVVLGATYTGARWIVGLLRTVLRRMDLHEEALLQAGWLRRNLRGELEVRPEHVRGRV